MSISFILKQVFPAWLLLFVILPSLVLTGEARGAQELELLFVHTAGARS